MPSRKPILFLVSGVPSYKLLRQFAHHCAAAGRSVHAWYEGSDPAVLAALEADAQRGVIALGRPDAPDASAGARAPRLRSALLRPIARRVLLADEERVSRLLGGAMPRAAARKLARRLAARSALSPNVLVHARALAAALAQAAQALARADPRVLVVSEDGISGALPVLTAARTAAIPVLDIPYGFGVRRDLEIDLGNKEARGERIVLDEATPAGRLLRAAAPQWIKTGEHAGALMYPPEYILASEAVGMTLRDPWIIHGGFADVLCAESAQMESVYLAEGVPARKLRRTGSPYCDAMVQAVAANPAAKHALRSGKRIREGTTKILVSWPPSYHDVRGRFAEFPSYEEMTRRFFEWLRALPGCELTVSLHPAVSAAARRLVEETGAVPDERYVIDLIPQHDLFVTYFSSTIRWAIACGKPVVNYDAYGLGLDIYDSAPGFINARTLAQSQQALSRLAGAAGAFEALASQQATVAERWGTLDGKCNERILAELDALARAG